MGYQFFGGKFYRCIDKNGQKYHFSKIANRTECFRNSLNGANSLNGINNYRWETSKINFNNALNGFLALFQVVSLLKWNLVQGFISLFKF